MFDIGRFTKLAAAAAVATVGISGAANASTTIDLITNPQHAALVDATVTCSIFCQGWTGSGWTQVGPPGNPSSGSWTVAAWSPDEASSDGGNPSDNVLDLKFSEATGKSRSDYTKLESGDDYPANMTTFIIDTDYFWVFDASHFFLFRTFSDTETNPGEQTFSFFKGNGTEGPSNVGALSIQPIPLPATGWLMLSVLGLGGLVAHRKRKQKAA